MFFRGVLLFAFALAFLPALHAAETVTQSSTAFGGVASRAIDQNTDGNYRNRSVTHTSNEVEPWWTLDLGEQIHIGSVDVYNRTNCCTARLSDFYVFTSDLPFAHDDVQSTLNDSSVHSEFVAGAAEAVTTIAIGQDARYLRIQLSGRNPLSLAEVVVNEAVEETDNETGVVIVSQSSTGFGGVASRAYDQNTDGVYRGNSVSHTNNEVEPWWNLDLGEQTDIGSVVIYNRTDCCTARLSDFYVFTSDVPFAHNDAQLTLNDPNVFSEFFAGAADAVTTIAIGQDARYLRIQLSGRSALSLAEVVIRETDAEPDEETGAVIVSQSSTSHGGVASRAYDQNTNGVFARNSVTHTNNEVEPWWMLDLGEQTDISSVVIYNRTDACCTTRLSDFYVFTSDVPFAHNDVESTLNDSSVQHQFFSGAADAVNTLSINHAARYVRVQLSGRNPLSLAEVQIIEGEIQLPPQAVVLLAPLSDATFSSDAVVEFSWSPSDLATHYEFELYEPDDTTSTAAVSLSLLASECTDSTCSVSTQLLDNTASGAYSWRVRAFNDVGSSEWIASTFTVNPPVPPAPPIAPVAVSPAEGVDIVQGDRTLFMWNESPSASSYDFYLIDVQSNSRSSENLLATDICEDALCFHTVEVSLGEAQGHAWEVQANNADGSSPLSRTTFNVVVPVPPVTIPAVPTPVSPIGTDVIENTVFAFTWKQDPAVVTYDFFLFDADRSSDTFGEQPWQLGLLPEDLCDGTLCSYDVLVDLPIFENQRWRVRGRNSAGISGWTLTFFNVVELVTDPPPTPVTLSPQQDARLEIDTVTEFSWRPSDKASSYDFRVLDSANSDAVLVSESISARTCSIAECEADIEITLPIATSYEWQVRATNAAGSSAWTSTAFGTIKKATQRPSEAVNVSPRTGALVSQGSSVVFTWEREPDSVSYEFHFFDGANRTATGFVEDIQAEHACGAQLCSITQLIELPVADNHAWRVRGENSLGFSLALTRTTFEVIPSVADAPGPFEITAPLEGSEVQEGEAVTFTWNRSQYATEYEFALFDGDDFINVSAIETASVIHAECDTYFCSFTTSSQLPVADSYTARVRALNVLGETIWVDKSFAVVAEPITLPDAPVAIAPRAGQSVVVGQAVDFQWAADELALTYDFFLTNSDGDELPVVNGLVPAQVCVEDICTYTTVPDLPISGFNTWHVRAVYETEVSDWSVALFAVIAEDNGETPIAIIATPGFTSDIAGVAPLSVLFDSSESIARANNELTEYIWNFGDGSSDELSQSANTVMHVFTEPGSYVVQLTVTDDSGMSNVASKLVTVFDPATTPSDMAASRFLTQATFGPTRASILDVQSQGVENWLDNQFTLQGPAHLEYVRANSNGSNRAARHEVWWSDVVSGEDQLRQRVAFALSQIFVVSDTGYTLSNAQFGITNYYDMLRENAFGNYRELLEQVTLSPVMGLYLSMLQNAKSDESLSTRADENYAREVLQLFSIGLHQLNPDGTTSGDPVFTQDNIEAFARSFTGWNYADAGTWNRRPFTGADVISPMLPFQSFHDTEPKTLLNGVTTPANQGARADLEMALDNIFNHSNVGPFIVKQLIVRLVTSNPTPAYVQRIASVFNDDGNGERGNLQAVIRALLLDDEARSIPTSNTYGKLREPVLRLSNLWRAFNIQPGSNSERGEFTTISPALENLDVTTGQAVLKSPSVFNFFQPSFSPAGPIADDNLVAPEFELFTESNELATSNRIGRQIQEAYLGNPDSAGQRNAFLDFAYERKLASDPDALLNHLDTLLMSGNLSTDFRAILYDHISGLPDTDDGLSQRVRDAITIIMASPDYLVQM